MLKSIRLAILALIMLAPFASAVEAAQVGVLNQAAVLSESNAGKRYAKASEAKFKPQIDSIEKLRTELRTMEEKLRKDGQTLSEEQLKIRQLEMRRKVEDLQLKDRQLRVEKSEADNVEMQKLIPMVQSAIDQVVKAKKLDLVLDRQAAIYVSPSIDITRDVVDTLNQMK
ncbi:OmpH family outer membrane protein [uncultured Endozoicomonas sp.]|uniref:OmpH family outer membrane protein n=1 Tax=uncultured Endozoicomonas sp. TaxID=432652 RepID=UPI00263A0A7E|nr:OmpH family outer membrane protein [uncultured Endozoicomonas sp.]